MENPKSEKHCVVKGDSSPAAANRKAITKLRAYAKSVREYFATSEISIEEWEKLERKKAGSRAQHEYSDADRWVL